MISPLLWLPDPWRQWLTERSVMIQRLIIIPLTLLLAFFLAERAGGNIGRLIIIAPALLAGALAVLRWPPLGLISLVLISLSFNQEIVQALGVTTLVTLGLAGLWLFDMIVVKKRVIIAPLKPFLPFVAFVVVGLLSIGTAQYPYYPVAPAPMDAQFGGLLIIVVAFLVFIMAAHHITSIAWLKWLTFVFIGVGGLYLALRFIPGGNPIAVQLITFPVLGHSMFWCWLVAMSFSQAVFNKELAPYWRGGLAAIAAAAIYLKLFETTDWVSGWLPSLIAMVVIVWAARPRLAYALTIVGGFILATQITPIMENLIYVGDNQYSEMTRLEAWRIIFDIIRVNPLLGVGFANYSFYTPLFPILGWFVQFNSHNNYVDIIAQTGILGMLCVLWLFFEIGRVCWRVYLMMRDEQNGFVIGYVYAAIGGFAATVMSGMLGDWVLPYVYNITIRGMRASILPWLFLGGLLALEQILIYQRANQAQLKEVNA